MKRRLIWCLSVGFVAAVSVFLWFGVRPWTIVLTLVLLVCPAVLILGASYMYRGSNKSSRGQSMPFGNATTRKHIDRS